MSKIVFAADKDDGKALAEVQDFGNPLGVLVSSTWAIVGMYTIPSLERCRASQENR